MSSAVPSPFGKLLRRSKFASYDPTIGQAYTTYGGHAYRGNWGVKRPLPNRRKTGFIHIRSIDSKEQQTEWHSAESSARWIRRWDETGKMLKLTPLPMGQWSLKNPGNAGWSPDTEFSPNPHHEHSIISMVNRGLSKVPPLSSHQFQRYLDRIRAARPSFKQFAQKELKSQPSRQSTIKVFGSGEVDMYSSAQSSSSSLLLNFRKRCAHLKFESSDPSVSIGSSPHIYAGLEHTVLPPLQIRYLYGPSSGRILARNVVPPARPSALRDHSHKVSLVGVAGITGEMSSKDSQTMDRETARLGAQACINEFRIAQIQLSHPPEVVRRRPKMAGDTVFESVMIHPSHGETNLANPYPLGSRDYVGKHAFTSHAEDTRPNTLTSQVEEGRRLSNKPKSQGGSRSKNQNNEKETLASLIQITSSQINNKR